ncbi:hypothetical protein P9112_003919 [Eukaryota sp. TZLM1-RC]
MPPSILVAIDIGSNETRVHFTRVDNLSVPSLNQTVHSKTFWNCLTLNKKGKLNFAPGTDLSTNRVHSIPLLLKEVDLKLRLAHSEYLHAHDHRFVHPKGKSVYYLECLEFILQHINKSLLHETNEASFYVALVLPSYWNDHPRQAILSFINNSLTNWVIHQSPLSSSTALSHSVRYYYPNSPSVVVVDMGHAQTKMVLIQKGKEPVVVEQMTGGRDYTFVMALIIAEKVGKIEVFEPMISEEVSDMTRKQLESARLEIFNIAEKIKRECNTSQDSVDVFCSFVGEDKPHETKLNINDFIIQCQPLLEELKKCSLRLFENQRITQINDVILIGGGLELNFVRENVLNLFGFKKGSFGNNKKISPCHGGLVAGIDGLIASHNLNPSSDSDDSDSDDWDKKDPGKGQNEDPKDSTERPRDPPTERPRDPPRETPTERPRDPPRETPSETPSETDSDNTFDSKNAFVNGNQGFEQGNSKTDTPMQEVHKPGDNNQNDSDVVSDKDVLPNFPSDEQNFIGLITLGLYGEALKISASEAVTDYLEFLVNLIGNVDVHRFVSTCKSNQLAPLLPKSLISIDVDQILQLHDVPLEILEDFVSQNCGSLGRVSNFNEDPSQEVLVSLSNIFIQNPSNLFLFRELVTWFFRSPPCENSVLLHENFVELFEVEFGIKSVDTISPEVAELFATKLFYRTIHFVDADVIISRGVSFATLAKIYELSPEPNYFKAAITYLSSKTSFSLAKAHKCLDLAGRQDLADVISSIKKTDVGNVFKSNAPIHGRAADPNQNFTKYFDFLLNYSPKYFSLQYDHNLRNCYKEDVIKVIIKNTINSFNLGNYLETIFWSSFINYFQNLSNFDFPNNNKAQVLHLRARAFLLSGFYDFAQSSFEDYLNFIKKVGDQDEADLNQTKNYFELLTLLRSCFGGCNVKLVRTFKPLPSATSLLRVEREISDFINQTLGDLPTEGVDYQSNDDYITLFSQLLTVATPDSHLLYFDLLYQWKTELDSPKPYYLLGLLYIKEQFVEKDLDKSHKLLLQGLHLDGCPTAILNEFTSISRELCEKVVNYFQNNSAHPFKVQIWEEISIRYTSVVDPSKPTTPILDTIKSALQPLIDCSRDEDSDVSSLVSNFIPILTQLYAFPRFSGELWSDDVEIDCLHYLYQAAYLGHQEAIFKVAKFLLRNNSELNMEENSCLFWFLKLSDFKPAFYYLAKVYLNLFNSQDDDISNAVFYLHSCLMTNAELSDEHKISTDELTALNCEILNILISSARTQSFSIELQQLDEIINEEDHSKIFTKSASDSFLKDIKQINELAKFLPQNSTINQPSLTNQLSSSVADLFSTITTITGNFIEKSLGKYVGKSPILNDSNLFELIEMVEASLFELLYNFLSFFSSHKQLSYLALKYVVERVDYYKKKEGDTFHFTNFIPEIVPHCCELLLNNSFSNSNLYIGLCHYFELLPSDNSRNKAIEFFETLPNDELACLYQVLILIEKQNNTNEGTFEREIEQLHERVGNSPAVLYHFGKYYLDKAERRRKVYLNSSGQEAEQLLSTINVCKQQAFDCFQPCEISHFAPIEGVYHLAVCYLTGSGTEKNKEKALELLQRTCAVNHVESLFLYGINCSNECPLRDEYLRNYISARKNSTSDERVVEAHFLVGQSCYDQSEFNEAIPFLNYASEAENSEATRLLQQCMRQVGHEPEGVSKKAVKQRARVQGVQSCRFCCF